MNPEGVYGYAFVMDDCLSSFTLQICQIHTLLSFFLLLIWSTCYYKSIECLLSATHFNKLLVEEMSNIWPFTLVYSLIWRQIYTVSSS
jgi:hypothetical protein